MTSQIRAASAADLEAVAALSQETGSDVAAISDGKAGLLHHLSVYVSAGGHIFVAGAPMEASGINSRQITGFVLCRVVEPLLYAREPALVVDGLYVIPAARRRGVGAELMHAAAQVAAEIGSPFVYAVPAAAERGMHRFLARLGFAPVVGQRVVATSTLLRRLEPDDPITQAIAIRSKARTPARTSIQDVVARRKRARGIATGPISVTDVARSIAGVND
jgi:GNAT superfamily N-acetyltransferase